MKSTRSNLLIPVILQERPDWLGYVLPKHSGVYIEFVSLIRVGGTETRVVIYPPDNGRGDSEGALGAIV